MRRPVVLVQLLFTALFAAVGGFVAVSAGTDAVDANPGGMTAAVPMMTEAQLRSGGASASSDLATTTITPVRILDTRPGAAAMAGTKTPWGPLEIRTVQAAGLGSIPSDAVGVVVNVTVLNATAPDTFLTLYPTGAGMPNASTINPQQNQVAFNAATVLLGNGTFEIYNYSGTVDVIIDVVAYMTRDLADRVDSVTSAQAVVNGAGNEMKIVDANGDEIDIVQVSRDGTRWVSWLDSGMQYSYGTIAMKSGGNYYAIYADQWDYSEYISYSYYESADCSGQPHQKLSSDQGSWLGFNTLPEYVEYANEEGGTTYNFIFRSALTTEFTIFIPAETEGTTYRASYEASNPKQVMASRYEHYSEDCQAADYTESVDDYSYYAYTTTPMPTVAFPLDLVEASP